LGVSSWGLSLVINLVLFVLPALFRIPASAENNNVRHLYTVATNLLKWHDTDPAGCAAYCTKDALSLRTFYELLVARGEANDATAAQQIAAAHSGGT
jgi:hypothetical protein